MKEILFIFVFAVAVVFGSFYLYSYVAPKYVEVDNRVFHESQSYNDGFFSGKQCSQLRYVHWSRVRLPMKDEK